MPRWGRPSRGMPAAPGHLSSGVPHVTPQVPFSPSRPRHRLEAGRCRAPRFWAQQIRSTPRGAAHSGPGAGIRPEQRAEEGSAATGRTAQRHLTAKRIRCGADLPALLEAACRTRSGPPKQHNGKQRCPRRTGISRGKHVRRAPTSFPRLRRKDRQGLSPQGSCQTRPEGGRVAAWGRHAAPLDSSNS